MKRFKESKVIRTLTVILVLFSTLPTQTQLLRQNHDDYALLANLYCFSNGKIESITGKKRSILSPKVVKAWKLGNLEFIYSRPCGLVQNNPLLLRDAQFYYQAEWREKVRALLQQQDLLQEVEQKRSVASVFDHQEAYSVLSLESKAASQFASLAERMRYADRCEKKFIAKNGFGPLGRTVKEALSHNAAKDLINHDISFGGACPGYREMNSEQRKNLWVFVMMSMSHYESSCKETATNQGPYGLASGLLQLHDESEDIYTKWDPDLNCDKGASRNAKKSLKCALTMIGNQLYKGVPFFDDNSHWQVLRKAHKPGTQAFHIRYALTQIPDCKSNPFYVEIDFKINLKTQKEVFRQKNTKIPSVELAMLR